VAFAEHPNDTSRNDDGADAFDLGPYCLPDRYGIDGGNCSAGGHLPQRLSVRIGTVRSRSSDWATDFRSLEFNAGYCRNRVSGSHDVQRREAAMSQPVTPGRVDHLAKGIFQKLVKRQANPAIKLACNLFDEEITEAFEETFGPGTKAHEIGRRVIRAMEGEK
jgi:hypothetical protein